MTLFVKLVSTTKFCVLADVTDKDVEVPVVASNTKQLSFQQKIGIFLDIDEPYTRNVIQNEFNHPDRSEYFRIVLGPGYGMDAVPVPDGCQFQWSEYERIDWDSVLAGQHKASSYMIRKGLSRKAQLAHYTQLYVCKHPNSILKTSIPKTIIIDTWSVWEDNNTNLVAAGSDGLADVIMSMSSSSNNHHQSNCNQKVKLEKCLVDAKIEIQEAEHLYTIGVSTNPPVWILKGSTTNKGKGIYIVHCYEQVVDICWSESDIREW